MAGPGAQGTSTGSSLKVMVEGSQPHVQHPHPRGGVAQHGSREASPRGGSGDLLGKGVCAQNLLGVGNGDPHYSLSMDIPPGDGLPLPFIFFLALYFLVYGGCLINASLVGYRCEGTQGRGCEVKGKWPMDPCCPTSELQPLRGRGDTSS